MPKPSHFKISVTVAFVAVLALLTVFASATEVQLAGVRLGAHYSAVVKAWGQPDSVIIGADGPGSVGFGGGGAATATAGPTAAGPGGGMPGMMGGGMGGPGGAMRPGGAGGVMPGMMGAGGGPGGPGGAMRPGGAAGGGMPGMMGAGGGGAPAAAGGSSHSGSGTYGAEATNVDWGSVSQVQLTSKETRWCYGRSGVSLVVVLDRDGFVTAVAVGGKNCSWARTALGEPLRTIKLGDSFKRVIERYGYPQDTTVLPGASFSHDSVLHFGYNQNVDFTLRDMKVRQIYIWEAEIRSTSK